MSKMKKVFKYLGITVGALLFLWIALIVSLYFVVDAEDIRKVAQDYFKQNTNAELQIKNLDLGFFPMFYVDIQEMRLVSSLDKKELLYCKEAKLHFSVMSLIRGKPRIYLTMQSPAIEIVPNMGAVFSKNTAAGAASATPPPAQEVSKQGDKKEDSSNIKIPSYLVLTKVEVDINDAALTYNNAVSSYSFKGIDLNTVLDVLTKTVDIDLLVPVDLKQGTMTIVGDLKAKVNINSPDFKSVDAKVVVDATGLDITAGTIQKTKRMDLIINMDALADQNSLNLKNLMLTILDQHLVLNGKITNLQTAPELDLVIPQANLSIGSLKKLESSLNQQKISGNIGIKGYVKGGMKPLPLYNIVVTLNNIETVYAPAKAKIATNGTIAINNSTVVADPLTVNVDQSSIGIKAKVENYMSNLVTTNVSINSNLIDLSPFVPKPEKKKTESKKETPTAGNPPSGNTKGAAGKGNEDFEVVKKDMVVSLKPVLAKYPTTVSVNIKKIKMHDVEATDVKGGLIVNKDGVAAKGLSMKTMDGQITSELAVLLNGEAPQVTGGLVLSSIKLAKATLLVMPDLKDAVSGDLSAKLNLNASGYTFLGIRKNLKANGDFSLQKFVCNTASLNDMLKPQLEKIPFIKDKVKLSGSKGIERVTGLFHMENERIYLDKFEGVEGEYEVKGKGELSLDEYMDLYLDSYWPFSALPYEGIKQPNGKVMIPTHLVGPVMKPRVDMPYTMKYLTDRSLNYEKERLLNEAKQKAQQEADKIKNEAKQKAQQEADKVKNEAKQKAGTELKKLIKGFKF